MDRHLYTVAVICALPLELAAVQVMLDEIHSDLPRKPNDNNTYTLGRMGKHHVVIACLPAGITGTVSAATVASELRFSFPSVRFGLMVGVAGGVPGKHDVRLGDIVISQPSGTFGGVVQYDFGKTVQDGKFVMTGQLSSPPTALLTAVSKLAAKHKRQGSQIVNNLARACQRFPDFRSSCKLPDGDELFKADYDHPTGKSTCEHCEKSRLIKRPARPGSSPVVHYGLIASGNQVMRYAQLRDEIGQKFDVLCFEMEAAGLMNSFPCATIRGICDYADSHKNKEWQPYAASVAAAYARELLEEIPIEEVVETRLATETVDHQDSWQMSLYRPRSTVRNMTTVGPKETWEVQKGAYRDVPTLLSRISDYNPEVAHQRLSRRRLAGTCDWFLLRNDVKDWIRSPVSTSLWCSGAVGSGKTMVFTSLVDHLKGSSSQIAPKLVFFYCESADIKTLSASYLLRSLIKQLLQQLQALDSPFPDKIVPGLEYFFSATGPDPDLGDLTSLFSVLASSCPRTVYMMDGLDEMDLQGLPAVMSAIHGLIDEKSETNAKIFIASRDELGLNIRPNMDVRVHIFPLDTKSDIQHFISSQIEKRTKYERVLSKNDGLVDRVKQTLTDEADGMFLWARLQIEALWMDCICDEQIISALKNLPPDLPAMYDRCVARMPLMTKEIGMNALKWVSLASRPLNIHELQEAVSFRLSDETWESNKLISLSILMASCANLVAFDRDDQTIRLAHSSVKKYLFESGQGFRHFNLSIPIEVFAAQADLELGEACVNYLSFSNFTLEMEKAKSATLQAAMPIPATISTTLPFPKLLTKLSEFLVPSRAMSHVKVPTLESYRPRPRPRSDPSHHAEFALLDYARQNWAIQTKAISTESKIWNKFVALALEADSSRKKHPWKSDSLSSRSNLHSLLIWASRERHLPLLGLVLDKGPRRHIESVCNLPCVDDGLAALHIACRLGYQDVAEMLLKVCDVNALGPSSRTALHYAVEKGHAGLVSRLLRVKGVRVSVYASELSQHTNGYKSYMRETALGVAARTGSTSIIQLLLDAGASIVLHDALSVNPLVAAARRGHIKALQILLDHLTQRGFESIAHEALTTVIVEGQVSTAKLLLERAPFTAKPGHHEDHNPLILAVEYGGVQMVELLLDQPETIVDYQRSKTKGTALCCAAKLGDESIVALLLARKANVNLANNGGESPLLCAIRYGHGEVFQMLLDHDADVNVSSSTGESPLLLAIEKSQRVTVQTLLECGADPNKTDARGNCPLIRATRSSRALVQTLLEHGADPNMTEARGDCPLITATRNDEGALVQTLLEHGANPNMSDAYGTTALCFAVAKGYKEIVALLIAYQADMDLYDFDGRPPLLLAAELRHSSVFELLLDSGASANLLRKHYEAFCRHADISGQSAIVRDMIKRSGIVSIIRGNGSESPFEFLVGSKDGATKVVVPIAERGISSRFPG